MFFVLNLGFNLKKIKIEVLIALQIKPLFLKECELRSCELRHYNFT